LEPWIWLDIGEALGEVFLHEWLHGIESFMTTWGYTWDDFPVDGLHGQEHYGYKHSPPSGWMGWYSDFMQGKVWDKEQGRYLGVTKEMWAIGSPTSLINIEKEDSNLERIIRDIINKPSGEIMPRDVRRIVELVANEEGIMNLNVIQHLTNLERLSLEFNRIRDISPLAALKRLSHLSLNDNRLSDISALAGLKRLKNLALHHNSIEIIDALAGLTNLDDLNLWGNHISDISPLEGLGRLEQLNLGANDIGDISALAGLTNLKWLGLRYNKIRDISVLEGLTSLESVDLEYNHLDLSPGSDSMKTIQTLIDRGVDVGYLP
jgi:hypothetical protein